MVHNITNHNNKKYTWCNIVLKFVSDLRQLVVFSGYSVSSTNNTDRLDITEILLKVV